jgi:hypothetical protein
MESRTTTGPVGRLWLSLVSHFRVQPIATPDELRAFLDQRASFIAQKCAIDYCRGKTGLASYALFTEEPFLKALDVCRWETYVTVLGDLVILAEGYLRPHAVPERRPRLRDALGGLYSDMLAGLPSPPHRESGWSDAIAPFGLRLETACAGEPRRALDVADHSARRLFETLPIHANMRALDEEVVYGAVRFRMIAVSQEMQRRFVGADLAGSLIAQPPAGSISGRS